MPPALHVSVVHARPWWSDVATGYESVTARIVEGVMIVRSPDDGVYLDEFRPPGQDAFDWYRRFDHPDSFLVKFDSDSLRVRVRGEGPFSGLDRYYPTFSPTTRILHPTIDEGVSLKSGVTIEWEGGTGDSVGVQVYVSVQGVSPALTGAWTSPIDSGRLVIPPYMFGRDVIASGALFIRLTRSRHWQSTNADNAVASVDISSFAEIMTELRP